MWGREKAGNGVGGCAGFRSGVMAEVLFPGGGTWVFFGWVSAARYSKLAPRSRKNFP